jgi:hypothetical protein
MGVLMHIHHLDSGMSETIKQATHRSACQACALNPRECMSSVLGNATLRKGDASK